MSSSFSDFLSECQLRCKEELLKTSTSLPGDAGNGLQKLAEAISYSLSNTGKCIRPVMVYAATLAAGGSPQSADPAAAALELIHTYSLIHDDLPAMDDDSLRRGKPTVHVAYDVATAILSGDALQALAFEILSDSPKLSPVQKVEMIKVLAQAAGPNGMVGGQAIDIAATGSDMNLEQLQGMHALKTGALIRASLALGGIAGGASDEQLKALDDYGTQIGLAFQVVDDILDVEGDTETLGKTQGKDRDADKPTYVKLLGLEEAKNEAQRLLALAIDSLQSFGENADQLRDLARYIVERDH